MAQRLFISDLHLSPEQPRLTALFLDFLNGRAGAADELYILGDLFDSWIGDDDDTPAHRHIIAALRALTERGTACYLMRGNRDFLLGRRFADASGCRLLRDPTVIQIGQQRVLLMHGDLLCSDDIAYQRFRRRVRNPLVQALFRLKPLARRRDIAVAYRERSRAATADKQPASMDVNAATIQTYLRRYRADRLVHGHTHRPGDHDCEPGGGIRQVLSDWRRERGEVLVEDYGTWRRESVPCDSDSLCHLSAI